ncbi:MAG: FeoB-associated Cys-rich membrane protein [Bacillota bacterium]|nr:FeoB-associated Cys-rich membrane protein [Bacillota bacterium]
MAELIITVLIILLSVYIIYKNIRNKSKGKCSCGSCSSHCPYYKEKADR